MRTWWGALAALVVVRVAISLAVYAAEGSSLPDVPPFVRPAADGGLQGDATGFYEGSREFMAAWARMPRALLAADAAFVLAAAVAATLAWRRRAAWRPWLVPCACLAIALVLATDIHWMRATGAAVIGWPIVWSLPMLPLRALGSLDPAGAWDVGTALSLVFVGTTVVAVACLGRNATRSPRLGLLAAAFWATWPLLVGVIAGHTAWMNDQWFIDVGLHNYDEPLSTLLVTAGAAVLLAPRLTPMRLAFGGCVLSYATSVKLSNALVAGVTLAILLLRIGRRRALLYVAGVVSFAPVVLAYWPLSYPTLFANRKAWPHDPFDVGHFVSSWTHSSIFDPHTLAIVVPLAAIGAFALKGPWETAVVLAFLLINPLFYSFFANTAEHPRFLYASLPEMFTLWAAAVGLLVTQERVGPVLARARHSDPG